MASQTDPPRDDRQVGRTIELLIRVGVVVLIVFWCFTLVRPFIVPFVWGVIIAIATFPFFERPRRALGNRRILAAVLLALVLLVLIIVPAMLLGSTLLDTAQRIGAQMNAGTLVIPPPPPEIAEVPLIGDDIENFWQLASENLRAALDKVGPQIRALGRWLLSAAAGTGIGILQFIFAIIIAAALQVNAGGGGRFADEVATRLAGERGPDFADLARDTIHSVARGILGVALIQAILAGLGFLAFGVPFAGFLALACLVLSIVQIGTAIVIVPVIIYIFSVADTDDRRSVACRLRADFAGRQRAEADHAGPRRQGADAGDLRRRHRRLHRLRHHRPVRRGGGAGAQLYGRPRLAVWRPGGSAGRALGSVLN